MIARPVRSDLIKGPVGFADLVIVEEGMREGLQIEDVDIPVDSRVELLDTLSETGLKHIVVGSFVSPKWVPQMARIDEVVSSFTPRPGVTYSALALNQRGIERRESFSPPLSNDHYLPSTLVHACDVFVRRNTNRSQLDEILSWPAAVARAVDAGATAAQIGVNAAWGSNWLGEFSHETRMDFLALQVELWTAAGIPVTRVFLGDPMGWHIPLQVEEDLRAITERWPEITEFHLHLHNTRGSAPITIYNALRHLPPGKTLIVDTSIGGMAGCPYCGNGRAASLMPTEDLVYLLDESGYETGVDLDRLIEAVALAERIVGHPLYGHVSKAGGRPRGHRTYPLDLPFIETLDEAQHFRLGPSAYPHAYQRSNSEDKR